MGKVRSAKIVSFFGIMAFVCSDQTSRLDYVLERLERLQAQNDQISAENAKISAKNDQIQAENGKIQAKYDLMGQKVHLFTPFPKVVHFLNLFLLETAFFY